MVYAYITHDPSGGNNDYTDVLFTPYQPPTTIQTIDLALSVIQQNTASGSTGTPITSLVVGGVNQAASGASASSVLLNNPTNVGANNAQITTVNAANPNAVR